MWLNKDPETVEHEYIVIGTLDRINDSSRLFILDQMDNSQGWSPPRGDENQKMKKPGIVILILQKFPWLLYLIPQITNFLSMFNNPAMSDWLIIVQV